MRKIIVLLAVCAVISTGAFFYLRNNGESSQVVADTSPGAGKPTQDGNSPPEDQSGATGNPTVQQSASAAAPVGLKPVELPFEKNLIEGNSLSVAKIQTLLQSKSFEIQLDKFTNEAVADDNASELTAAYKDLLSNQLQSHKIKAELAKLTCGIETCIGLIRNGTDDEYNRWADIFFQDPATPNYGFANFSFRQDDGDLEHRFVFSTDPAVNSVLAPRK